MQIISSIGALLAEKSILCRTGAIFMCTLRAVTEVGSSEFSTINAIRSGYSGHAVPTVYLKATYSRSIVLRARPFILRHALCGLKKLKFQFRDRILFCKKTASRTSYLSFAPIISVLRCRKVHMCGKAEHLCLDNH